MFGYLPSLTKLTTFKKRPLHAAMDLQQQSDTICRKPFVSKIHGILVDVAEKNPTCF
jgi:hypothetical protein